MILSILVISQFVGSSSPAFAADAPLAPSRSEVEREMAENYRAQILTVLAAIDPNKTMDALVKVTLAPTASLDGIAEIEAAPDEYLPGTLKVDNDGRAKKRRRFEENLAQTKDVLVIGPAETPTEVRESIGRWITQELKLGQKEPVQFQERPVLKKPESNRAYWLAAIAALALVAAAAVLGLLLLMNRKKEPPKPKAEEPLAPPENPWANKEEPKAPEEKKKDAETSTFSTIQSVLDQIRRVSTAHPEAASTALSHLVNRAELLGITANVVSTLGMDSALELFPRVSPAVWARLGDALSEETSTGALTIEEFQIFGRALNGEIARAQRKVNEVKMLPTLEKQNSAQISTRINGAGAQQAATMLALLSEPAINEVVPMIAKKDLGQMLTKMLTIKEIAKEEIAQFDKAEENASSSQNVQLDSVAKVASALAALPAGEEMAMFDQLNERQGGRLLAEIAVHRFYPPHIQYLPKDVVSSAIQSRELDELRKLTQSRPDLRDYVLRFVSERQREALEDSASELTDGSAVWRTLCDDLYARMTKSMGSAQISNLFSTRRVS